MDEIVYTETRRGRMETDREKHDREERNFRRWDRLGPWLLPLLALVLTLNYLVSEWVK